MNKTLKRIILIIVIFGGLGWVMMGMPPHPRIGYAPEQPFNYNHKIHAGDYKIDCQYCHTGVTTGRKAGVPSLNICLNCHANGIVGTDKVYGETKDEDGKAVPLIGEDLVTQLVELADAAADEPVSVQWTRIHNLPDHVRFSHAPHVAKFSKEGEPTKEVCKLCHGDIASMEVVEQVETLNMGFCISCHKKHKDDEVNNAMTNCSACHY